jgi:hypothetical protein
MIRHLQEPKELQNPYRWLGADAVLVGDMVGIIREGSRDGYGPEVCPSMPLLEASTSRTAFAPLSKRLGLELDTAM